MTKEKRQRWSEGRRGRRERRTCKGRRRFLQRLNEGSKQPFMSPEEECLVQRGCWGRVRGRWGGRKAIRGKNVLGRGRKGRGVK